MKLSAKLLFGIILLVCVGLSTQFPSRGRHNRPSRRDNRAEGQNSAGRSRRFGRRETGVERSDGGDWDRRRFPGDAEGRHDENDRRPGHHGRPDENDRRKTHGEERRKGGHKPRRPLVCLVQYTNGTVKQMWACPPSTTCNKGPRQIKNNRTDIETNLYFCTRINGSKPNCDDSEETTEKRPDSRPDDKFDDEQNEDFDRPNVEDAEEDEDDDSAADDDDNDDIDDDDDRRQGKNRNGRNRGTGRRGRRGGRGGRRGGRARGRGRRHPFSGPRPLGCRLVKADGNITFKRDCPKQLKCDSRPQTWNISGEEMKARFCVHPHGKPTRGNRSHSIDGALARMGRPTGKSESFRPETGYGASRFQEQHKRQGPEERRGNHERKHKKRFPLVCLVEFTNGTVRQMWACPPGTTCNKGPRVFNRTDIDMNLYFCSGINGSNPDCNDSEETSEERDEIRSGDKVDADDEEEFERLRENEEDDNQAEEDDGNDDRHKRQDDKFKGRGHGRSVDRRSRGKGHEGRHGRSGRRKGGRRPFPHHRPMGCRLIKADGKEKFQTDCPWQFECNTNRSQAWNISGESMKAYFCVPPHHGKPLRNGKERDQGERGQGEKPESADGQKPKNSASWSFDQNAPENRESSDNNRRPNNRGNSNGEKVDGKSVKSKPHNNNQRTGQNAQRSGREDDDHKPSESGQRRGLEQRRQAGETGPNARPGNSGGKRYRRPESGEPAGADRRRQEGPNTRPLDHDDDHDRRPESGERSGVDSRRQRVENGPNVRHHDDDDDDLDRRPESSEQSGVDRRRSEGENGRKAPSNDHGDNRDGRPNSGKRSGADRRRQEEENGPNARRDDDKGNDNRDRRPEDGEDGKQRGSRPGGTRGRRDRSRHGNGRPRGGRGRPGGDKRRRRG